MSPAKPSSLLTKKRREISAKVRELRRARKWSQAELATQLGLSQNRLSEIERGAGSFTAEQLLLLLTLFNVSAAEFVGEPRERDLELQNALARFGASHLHEATHVLLSEELSDVGRTVREALVNGSPRIITALAPVLVKHARTLNLRSIQTDLQRLGFETRLPWVIENTLAALSLISNPPPRRLISSVAALQLFVNVSRHVQPPSPMLDIMDQAIRTPKTVEHTQRNSSDLSRRWGIVTALRPEDFVEPLKVSLESA